MQGEEVSPYVFPFNQGKSTLHQNVHLEDLISTRWSQVNRVYSMDSKSNRMLNGTCKIRRDSIGSNQQGKAQKSRIVFSRVVDSFNGKKK